MNSGYIRYAGVWVTNGSKNYVNVSIGADHLTSKCLGLLLTSTGAFLFDGLFIFRACITDEYVTFCAAKRKASVVSFAHIIMTPY